MTMSESSSVEPAHGGSALLNRRTLATGLAWSAPVVALGAAAPVSAATGPPPGLQGWVTVSKSCPAGNGSITGSIDGTGTKYPTGIYGLYVLTTTTTTTVSNASITFFLPNAFGTPTWTQVGASQGWSTPVVNTTPTCPSGCPPNTTAYVMYYDDAYNGGINGWTQGTAPSGSTYRIANGVPNFTATSTTGTAFCSSGLAITAVRCVKVNGTDICFQRSITI